MGGRGEERRGGGERGEEGGGGGRRKGRVCMQPHIVEYVWKSYVYCKYPVTSCDSHVTHHSSDEVEVLWHDVFKVVGDEDSSHVQFDFV